MTETRDVVTTRFCLDLHKRVHALIQRQLPAPKLKEAAQAAADKLLYDYAFRYPHAMPAHSKLIAVLDQYGHVRLLANEVLALVLLGGADKDEGATG